MGRDPAIDTLLDLHGSILDQGGGYWIKIEHRHRHVSDQGVPYEFTDAQQLINDFFADVDRILSTTR